MDVIEKLIADHQQVREQTFVAEKLASLVDKEAFFWDNAIAVERFFEKEVREHFAIEERVLFPILRRVVSDWERTMLEKIESEHVQIMKLLNELSGISRQHIRYPSKSTRELFLSVCAKILDILMPHARREDEELYPVIKKRFTDAYYRELEENFHSFKKT